MPGNEAVKERIEQLLGQARGVFAFGLYGEEAPNQRGWLTGAYSAIQTVCPSETNPYHLHARSIIGRMEAGVLPKALAHEMAALLDHLLAEIKGGLLTTVENRAIAATFDDFLDHGAEYLKYDRKNEAAVIAGIVFEDTIRRICRVLGVTENGIALDTLISELAKKGTLTALKAKHARFAAGLRTSAAHARWEEIQLSDVKPVIDFTRELMAEHLG
jgi:hypothetical protein